MRRSHNLELVSAFLQVLVGAHAVLADGGVIAPVGIHVVALAAKKHSIPFVVLVGLHKLSPLFPHDPDLSYNGESLDGLALKALPSTGHRRGLPIQRLSHLSTCRPDVSGSRLCVFDLSEAKLHVQASA